MRILFLDDMSSRHKVIDEKILHLETEHTNTIRITSRIDDPFTLVHHVFSADEAIHHLLSWNFNVIFLDHDLGWTEGKDYNHEVDNGMKVVNWMIEKENHKHTEIIVHSMNIVKAPEMTQRLRDAGYYARWVSFAELIGADLLVKAQ